MKTFSGYIFIASFLLCCMNSMVICVPPTTCTGPNFSDPDDCSKYYACVGGKPVSMSCPPGLNYNEKTNQCDWPQNVPCNQKTTTKPPVTSTTKPPPATSTTKSPSPQPSQCGPQKKSVCYCEYNIKSCE